MRWSGESFPAAFEPDAGWAWRGHLSANRVGAGLPEESWRPSYYRGRLPTLTTCVEHPADRDGGGLSAEEWEHFENDGRRLPAAHYKEGDLFFVKDKPKALPRPPNAQEHEKLMGFPPGFT